LVAGSRWSFRGRRGNDHRTREPEILASRRDARTASAQAKPVHFRVRPKTAWQRLRERQDLLRDALRESLEDMALIGAIQLGEKFPLASRKKIFQRLDRAA